jgi:hypothetical protein
MPEQLKEAYLKVSHNPKGLQVMHDKDAKRMVNFKDIGEITTLNSNSKEADFVIPMIERFLDK